MTLFLLYVFILTLQIILSVSGEYFVIPNAEIIAYSPRGLEISIPDEDGMVLFAIHANINREMNHLEAGEISQDVTRKINNRWVYRNKNIRLKVGDTLYYWLFVIKDGLGYRRDDITHVVEELVPRHGDKAPALKPGHTTSTTEQSIGIECSTAYDISTTTQRIETTTSVHLAICEQTLTNVTQKLLSLTDELEELRKNNVIMKDIIEMDTDGRKLKLTGNLPTKGEPERIVQDILERKYSLYPKILTAYQSKDNSITFEVKLEDKVKIIRRQQEVANSVTSVHIVY